MATTIDVRTAAAWMARLSASDGVVSPREKEFLKKFAEYYGLPAADIIRMADNFAKDIQPEVELVDANALKGRRFEEFVVSLLADRTLTRLLAWRGDKIFQGIYAKDTLYPDLEIQHNLDVKPVEYFIECKYRSNWTDGKVDISGQFLRYRGYAKKQNKELFIALGIGGTPSSPEEFFIIPGRMIGYAKVIEQGRFKPCHCIPTPEAFHAYINHYFNKRVFKVKD